MLLKYSQAEKRTKPNVSAKQQRSTCNMKLTVGTSLTPRLHRKVIRSFGTKRPAVVQPSRTLSVAGREDQRTPLDPCDNSNDSGLGFDHHLEFQLAARSTLRFTDQEPLWANEHPEVKRKKLEIKLESDDANDNFGFPDTMNRGKKDSSAAGGLEPPSPLSRVGATPRFPGRVQSRPRTPGSTSLASQLMGISRDGKSHLQILCQPEQQHRARYQTEGSRGAVKDRSGNGFPVVKLVGYNKPATLQVFIGTDMGRVAPHMFYQACRVSGKNSTPCVEKKIDGTIVIEVEFDPAKDMVVTCDCVGILKERNVDVEHRFPDQSGARNKKKSTRCRMVFRTTITHPDGSTEILQTTSHPIVCTQPPGIPEICKKSLTSCPCTGGMELFVLGKNFLKDTRVVFQQTDGTEPGWEETVQPDKEFLQQTHLVCVVPPYQRCDLIEPVNVRLFVVSSGKTSEPHTFTYTPVTNPVLQTAVGTPDVSQTCLSLTKSGHTQSGVDLNRVFTKPALVPSTGMLMPGSTAKNGAILSGLPGQFGSPVDNPQSHEKEDVHPVRLWRTSSILSESQQQEEAKSRESEQKRALSVKLMPPPPPLLPLPSRGVRLIIPDNDESAVTGLKTELELLDENSPSNGQLSPEDLKGIDLRMKPVALVSPMATVADLSSTQSPSMATFRRFVSDSTGSPLPAQSAQSVEKYLSRLENPTTLVKCLTETILPINSCSSTSSVSQLGLDKLGVGGSKNLNNELITPTLLFEAQQQLVNNASSTAPDVQQKINYANNVALSDMYNADSSGALEKQQNASLEALRARTLLAVSLNTVVPVNQQKPVYGEPTLSAICNTNALLDTDGALPSAPESQLNDGQMSRNSFQPTTVSENMEPSMMVEPAGVLQTAASLIFSSPQSVTTNATMKTEEQLMDNLSKSNDQQSPTTVSSLLGATSHTLITPTANERLSQHLLADSSLLSVTPNTRLDALVSSAIVDTHILTPTHQTRAEKLDALVNSAAHSHIINSCSIPISADTSLLNTQGSTIVLNNQNLASEVSNSTPSLHVETMRLEPTTANEFRLNSLSSGQQSNQIPQDSLLLEGAVSAALNEHILTSASDSKASLTTENVMLNNVARQTLTIDTRTSPHMLIRSPTHTSPIAIKNMILSSPTSSSIDGQVLVTSSSHPSPIAVKNILLSSQDVDSDVHLSNQNRTSPIAIKSMVLNSSVENGIHLTSTNTTSPIAIKNMILNSASADNDIHIQNPNCTSPIAMKKLILDSSVALVNGMHVTNPNQNSGIDMKEMILNSQVSDNSLLSASSAQVENARLNALVESSVTRHILNTSQNQSSPISEDIRLDSSSLLASSTSPTLQQTSLVITQAPSLQPQGCITTSITPALQRQGSNEPPPSTDSLMNQHLTIFTTSTAEPLQTSCCNVTMEQVESLANAAQFTTVTAPSTQNLLTNATIPSKLSGLGLEAQPTCSGSTGFVNQMLIGLANEREIKNQLGSSILGESKTLQGTADYLTSEGKIPKVNVFTTTADVKSVGGSLPAIATKLDVVKAVQEQQQDISTNASVPVPVVELSRTVTPSKGTATGGPVQKKLEEGMVPQELTQMSDNDLLSYINPSCFDQV